MPAEEVGIHQTQPERDARDTIQKCRHQPRVDTRVDARRSGDPKMCKWIPQIHQVPRHRAESRRAHVYLVDEKLVASTVSSRGTRTRNQVERKIRVVLETQRKPLQKKEVETKTTITTQTNHRHDQRRRQGKQQRRTRSKQTWKGRRKRKQSKEGSQSEKGGGSSKKEQRNKESRDRKRCYTHSDPKECNIEEILTEVEGCKWDPLLLCEKHGGRLKPRYGSRNMVTYTNRCWKI